MKRSHHLTRQQAELIEWALAAGIDQFEKHLMHDDWDAASTPRSIIRSTKSMHRRLRKALETFKRSK